MQPKCDKCGNDGSEGSLFLTIDARWNFELKQWELEEREDDGGAELDCLNCDHRTPVRGLPLFPYGATLAPPADPDGTGDDEPEPWKARRVIVTAEDKARGPQAFTCTAAELLASHFGDGSPPYYRDSDGEESMTRADAWEALERCAPLEFFDEEGDAFRVTFDG